MLNLYPTRHEGEIGSEGTDPLIHNIDTTPL